jgi:hypothetical protein
MEASWLKFPIPISNLYFLLFDLSLSVLHFLHIECFALSGFQVVAGVALDAFEKQLVLCYTLRIPMAAG